MADTMTPAADPKRKPAAVYEIADMVTRTHWVLEQFAYDLPKGTATREQRDAIVVAVRGLAAVLEQHDMTGAPPLPAEPAEEPPNDGDDTSPDWPTEEQMTWKETGCER